MNFIEQPRLYRALGALKEYNQDIWQEVEDDIWGMFGVNRAVLVIDMSHFTKITKEYGIIYYMTLIKRMQDAVALSIPRHNGQLINFLADNAFIVFNQVDDALDCIQEVNARIKKHNEEYKESEDVVLCAGIDIGNILNIDNITIYGDPVNVASKLGEDAAEPWEVLISTRAHMHIQRKDKYSLEPHKIDESGVEDTVYILTS